MTVRQLHWSSKACSQGFQAIVLLAVITLLSTGCHKKRVRAPTVPPPSPGYTEVGLASWYGHPYHGRRAANGETYNMEEFTAAHRTLPFGTWVRVQNLKNGKTVDVRITDRGPFVPGRIIDLSRAAARRIGMIGPGTTKVRLEIISAPAALEKSEYFAVQVGAFRRKANARRLREVMEQRYGTARVVYRDGNPSLWRVLVGNSPRLNAMAALANKIRSEYGPAFVVRLGANRN